MRTGSEIRATTNSSAPCTAMPANRKGNKTSHTIGYKRIAITASGQQRMKRIHHSKNLIMIPLHRGKRPPLLKITQFGCPGFPEVLTTAHHAGGETYHRASHPRQAGVRGEDTVPDNGIVRKPSNYSVDETLRKLQDILAAQAVTVFALIDHSGEAEKVGIQMPPTKLLVFGNPKGGTPLMVAAPSIAIDLPLKILVAEDDQGKVSVSYNSPEYLGERHGLPQNLLQNIALVESLAASVAG